MIEAIIEKALNICEKDLGLVVKEALQAVFLAGNMIKDLYGLPHHVEFKGEIDLVTEADYKSEEILVDSLNGLGSGKIMAEESAGDLSLKDGVFWIVDPLDGTTNFAHGFPFFAPSVAYAKVENGYYETLFGIVYIPILRELFWSVKGKGCFLNLEKVGVSKEKALSRSLLATGFPYDIHQHHDDVIEAFKAMIVKAQGIRRAGAAAIDLAYVACGRFDGFWEKRLKPWDTAAGILLVEEAGGRVSGYSGQKYNPFLPEIVASNGFIHKAMVEILTDYSCQHTNI